MGGPTLILGDGYSPEGLEGPAVFFGEVGLGLKAVLPGDSEQLLSEPESSCRRLRIESSSVPARNKIYQLKHLRYANKCHVIK